MTYFLSELRHRLRALLRPRAVDRELEDELRFHLDQQIARDQQRGVTPADAARRGRIDLGGLQQVREACREERGVAPFERLVQDVGYAGRAVRKSPAFAAAVVITLALGIGATTTVFGIVDGVLLRQLPYRDAARLVQLGSTFGNIQVSALSPPDYFDIAARSKTLAAIGASRDQQLDIAGGGAPERVKATAASAAYFQVLGVYPLLGRAFSADDDRRGNAPVAMLSHSLWQRRFGGQAFAIGQTITLNAVPHVIVGVMPASFRGPDALSQQDSLVWVSFGRLGGVLDDRDDASWGVIGRMAPGTTIEAVRSELEAIGQDIGREHPKQGVRKFWVNPLRDQTVGDAGAQLWMLLAAVSVLLLIACANVANLFLVRATERTREMAIRAAMGAGRGRVARQLIAEGMLLALAGGILGTGLAFAGVAAFRAFGPGDLPRLADIVVDARVLAVSIAISTLAGLIFGLVPALDAWRIQLSGGLRDAAVNVTLGRPRTRLRSGLVVVQTSLALVLLVGAGLLINSLARLGRVQPGFDPADVVWLDVSLPARYADAPSRLAFFDELLVRARTAAGVRAAGGVQGRPLGGGNAVSSVFPEGRLPAEGERVPRVPFHAIAPGYFQTLGVPLVDGRDVGESDRGTAPRVAVVSRSFANRFWPGERAVGKRFWMGRVAADAPLTDVVGVVEDVLQYGLADAPQPIVYRPFAQVPRNSLSIVARHDGRAPADVIESLRQAAWSLDAALPLDQHGTMTGAIRESIGEPRFRAVAVAIFSAIAALLACVGLYGTLAWIVRARRRELGIRMVLGAGAGNLRRLVIRRGMTLALIGMAIGAAGAAASARLLQALVFGITPTDPATFAGALAVMALVMLLACYVPARRAGNTDPVATLRAE